MPLDHLIRMNRVASFAGSHSAAHNAAMLYSLLVTCKMNVVEPFQWLWEPLF